MARGGKRPGAGRPKGAKNRPDAPSELAKVDKELLREELRAAVRARMPELLAAQIANACGIKYLVARDKKTGKFRRLGEAGVPFEETLRDEEEVIEVWEKDPSVQAFTDLMNRTIDKPAETVQVDANVTVTKEAVRARIESGRKRVADGKR